MAYSSVSNGLKNVSRWESPMGYVNVSNMASVLALNATGSAGKLPDGGYVCDYLSWNGEKWVPGLGLFRNIHIGDHAGGVYTNSITDVGLRNNINNLSDYKKSVSLNESPLGSLSSICIGNYAGVTGQNDTCIAIGSRAGAVRQQFRSISLGDSAGQVIQGTGSISIGFEAGYGEQKENSIALGYKSGTFNQGAYSIAIGNNAGNSEQGDYSISIGNYANTTADKTIVLNAQDTPLSCTGPNSCFIAPVRDTAGIYYNPTGIMVYDSVRKEVCYDSGKSFIIDHPIDPSGKYLIHECLEGPEAGVYYRGQDSVSGKYKEIVLPEYVNILASDFTVNVTPIIKNIEDEIPILAVTHVNKGKFIVKSTISCEFNWIVNGKRKQIISEIDKTSVQIAGDGPYKYIKSINQL